jgi:hypothetical protein
MRAAGMKLTPNAFICQVHRFYSYFSCIYFPVLAAV